ncbi:MAG: Tol-Pal system beta propeller repeat protein TolB [Deltaproteobacteria bacterium]
MKSAGQGRRALIVGLFVLLGAAPVQVEAEVRGEIIGPGKTRLAVAVAGLRHNGGREHAGEVERLRDTLARDLELSGLFRVIPADAYLVATQDYGITEDAIDFDDWRAIGALGLVRGGYTIDSDGILVEIRFFDVVAGRSRGGKKIRGDLESVERIAHRTADAMIEAVTGHLGPFESRIAFVSDRNGHFREIYSFDFDGRVTRLSRHETITMAPAWGPDSQALAFTSFKDGGPALYKLDLASGRESKITRRLGVNVGAAWSPDGRSVLLAREVGGNTDIYTIDLSSGRSEQLTTHWGIDVDPAWSPDGRRVAFCSSRAGKPQIYTMNADGGGMRRLTFEGNYNCSPAWSPDGKTIAFAGRREGRFHIFSMPAKGGNVRQLTFEGANEDPTWSPDSRYIAFSSNRSGRKKIFLMDLSGRWKIQLTDGVGDDTSPSWSRRLGGVR